MDNEEKGYLPVPTLAFTQVNQAQARRVGRRRGWRFLAAFALLAMVGWNLNATRNRSLQADRDFGRFPPGGLNPDARGKLTVKQAEELFL